MAETLINFDTSYTSPRSALSDISDPPLSSVETPFNRKIEFHLARKPFNGFISGGEGFKLETLNPTKPDHHRPGGSKQESGYSGLAAKKPDGSELLDFGLDPELTFGITFRRIGAGLENLGNTCFLNSVLQCLTYTEPLAAYLQSGKHQNSCRTAGFCALCAIQKHVSRALQLSGRSLAPKDLVSNLRCISRSFRNARQEDAHEYMVNLLESMHKCCLPVGVPSESPSAYEKSLVHKIFGGRLRSQVKCTQCSFCSDKFDPFIDLSLEINKAESLNKALLHFTAKEYLDGGERQYQCQKCKHKVKALKQLSIHQAPYVLTIHLKRFGEHQPGQKIDKKVQFGPTLDLKPFVTGPYDGELKYTLYGVLVHAGWSTHSGHYYCYVRTSSGMWYSLDDHQVRQVGEKVVLEQKAYMLFYVRDRRNSALKKHVGYVQKENVIANAIGNIMHSNSNQGLKGTVPNGPVHKSVNGVDPSAAVTRKDAVITDALKETLMKEASIQKTKDPPLDSSSKVPVSGNAIDRPSDNPVNNSLGATPDGKTNNDCNKERGINKNNTDLIVQAPNNSLWPQDLVTKKNQSNVNGEVPEGDDISIKNNPSSSAAVIPKQNGHHSSVGDPCTAEKTPQKIHTEASLRDSDERKSSCIRSVRVLHKSSPENRQAKGLFKESTLADGGQRKGVIGSVGLSVGQTPHVLLKESTLADGGQRKGVIGSVGLSVGQTPHLLLKESTLAPGGQRKGVTGSVGLSVGQITRVSSHNGAVDSKYKRKLKKKLAKCQVNRVHLGSSSLFGAYLSLRKKQRKKMKRHIVKIHNLTRAHLMDTECSPSTSEITRTLLLDGSVHSRGKGLTSCSSEKGSVKNFEISTCELPKGIMAEEFRDRIGHNGAVRTTDKPPLRNFSSLTGNPSGARGANVSKECSRDTVQYGPEEKTAAPWEGIELPSSRITKSHDVEPLRVGYIGDEWDEEYDRGKRKKVRTSDIVYGGPNPFQVIASKKAKLKKVKMDQSSSGNRPFRI